MCGRYYNRRQKQQIAEQLRVGSIFDAPYEPNYSVAPTTFQSIVRQVARYRRPRVGAARWGLAPFFAKSLADFKGLSTFNARAEGIATSATWRGTFKTRRCLVPADEFMNGRSWTTARNPPGSRFRSR